MRHRSARAAWFPPLSANAPDRRSPVLRWRVVLPAGVCGVVFDVYAESHGAPRYLPTRPLGASRDDDDDDNDDDDEADDDDTDDDNVTPTMTVTMTMTQTMPMTMTMTMTMTMDGRREAASGGCSEECGHACAWQRLCSISIAEPHALISELCHIYDASLR
eukprot:323225-Rhodomonas_salina.3